MATSINEKIALQIINRNKENGKIVSLEERTGAKILVDVLNELNVEYIFGHTGGSVIPIHVELNNRYNNKEKAPQFIMFRQEGGAGHAAEGYAKLSGKVGVALATSGPGATNLITPIADAYKDSIPTVFITGQVPSSMIGNDSFQEVDMTGITRPITKQTYLVKDVEELGSYLRQAFYIARTGRPGPVVIDICKNALLETTKNGHEIQKLRGYNPKICMKTEQADSLLEEIIKAKRPVIKAGGGIISSNASQELKEFAEKYNIPVTLTFMGTGAIPHDHPLFLGMPGMHGTVAANYALKNADFILTIGGRFDDRVAVKGFAEGINVGHVDIDEAEINKNIKAQYPVHSDARVFLQYANKKEPGQLDKIDWINQVNLWKEKYPMEYDSSETIIKPQQLIEKISDMTNGKAIVTTGVGQHQMWTALYYNFQEPRQFISSGGLGTMGFGIPAAIGAHYANKNGNHKNKPIICIEGDGSFQMNIQELATVAANKIPIKTFIVNNGYLGMVRQWEDMFNSGNHYETCLNRTIECENGCTDIQGNCRSLNPDFLKISEMYPGIKTLRITNPCELESAIKQALSDNNPYVVDVWVDKTENVMPMIPAGKGISDLLMKK